MLNIMNSNVSVTLLSSSDMKSSALAFFPAGPKELCKAPLPCCSRPFPAASGRQDVRNPSNNRASSERILTRYERHGQFLCYLVSRPPCSKPASTDIATRSNFLNVHSLQCAMLHFLSYILLMSFYSCIPAQAFK